MYNVTAMVKLLSLQASQWTDDVASLYGVNESAAQRFISEIHRARYSAVYQLKEKDFVICDSRMTCHFAERVNQQHKCPQMLPTREVFSTHLDRVENDQQTNLQNTVSEVVWKCFDKPQKFVSDNKLCDIRKILGLPSMLYAMTLFGYCVVEDEVLDKCYEIVAIKRDSGSKTQSTTDRLVKRIICRILLAELYRFNDLHRVDVTPFRISYNKEIDYVLEQMYKSELVEIKET
jgi:hypothetical protein